MIETNYEFCFIIIIGNKGYMLLGMKRAEIFIVHAYMSYITLFMISIANAKRTMIFFHKYNNYFFLAFFFPFVLISLIRIEMSICSLLNIHKTYTRLITNRFALLVTSYSRA